MLIRPNLARRYGLVSCRSAGGSGMPTNRAASSRHPCFWAPCKMSACQGRISRQTMRKRQRRSTPRCRLRSIPFAQVGLSAFGPRSKSAISLLRCEPAAAR
jgi:hypothetical protein